MHDDELFNNNYKVNRYDIRGENKSGGVLIALQISRLEDNNVEALCVEENCMGKHIVSLTYSSLILPEQGMVNHFLSYLKLTSTFKIIT